MHPYHTPTQTILTTCIVYADGAVVLVRREHGFLADDLVQHSPYFDVPRFVMRSGEDPVDLVRRRVFEYFGVADPVVTLREVQTRRADDAETLLEIVYRVELDRVPPARPGRVLVVDAADISSYTFPDIAVFIRRYG